MAEDTDGRTIVAGIDGSSSARTAAKWAAREAALRKTSLLLVHACDVPAVNPRSPISLPRGYGDALREYGDDWLRDAEAAVAEAEPDVVVRTALEEGHPAEVLLGAAAPAQLVVLGSRGLGGFSSLLIGSIAVAVAGHAPCPVVVMRHEAQPDAAPVVAGVDGSEPSDRALGYAFEAAVLRGVPLVAVRAWTYATIETGWPAVPMGVSDEEIADNERRLLDESLGPWRDKFPEVAVEARVVRGRPVRTLLTEAETARAQLIVVGSRGRGALAGLGLGSVSQGMLHHADRPVAIVRPHP